jgi:hypothetical protein
VSPSTPTGRGTPRRDPPEPDGGGAEGVKTLAHRDSPGLQRLSMALRGKDWEWTCRCGKGRVQIEGGRMALSGVKFQPATRTVTCSSCGESIILEK